MKRKIIRNIIFGALIFLLPVVTYEIFLWTSLGFSVHYLSIDRCLDNGGCWDSIDETCRKDEPNAQALCDRSKKK